MTNQLKTLRLADALDALLGYRGINKDVGEAAAELRRLHEVNQELLEALKLADALLWGANMNAIIVERKIKAAIAKTGEQP